jgi:hypothetical protein
MDKGKANGPGLATCDGAGMWGLFRLSSVSMPSTTTLTVVVSS